MSKPFDLTDFIAVMESCLGSQDGPAKPFWKALSFAVDAHHGQLRKSGEPYISHPCHVAQILAQELEVTEPETLAAAILHDTVEDVPAVTLELIGDFFGRNVEAIVDGCTKVKVANFSGDRQAFSKLVHRKIFTGAASRIEVMLIKLADRLHNLRTIDSMPKHKRQKIADETLSIYAPMASIMGLFELKRELYNLALACKFPRQSKKLQTKINKIISDRKVAETKQRIQTALGVSWISTNIFVVPKGLGTYFDPTKQVLNMEIETPIEIIIVVPDVQTCYRALGVINQLYPPIPGSICDFIAKPKSTGYQSLHSRANIEGRNYLFKFRTDEMYHAGRSGIIRKWLDNQQCPSVYEKEIKEILNILGDDDLSYTAALVTTGGPEIYTYTPKGERICLPRNSTVLDFAFKVHSEIGRHCKAAIIGSRHVGINHILEEGDRVQIITRSDDHSKFEPEMLELCQTAKARLALSKIFCDIRQLLAQDIGESIIRQEMKRYGLPIELLNHEQIATILKDFEVDTLEDLYREVGSGRARLKGLIQDIKNILFKGPSTMEPPVGVLNQIILKTIDPTCVKLSRCCSPIPTVKCLYGIPSPRGLSVHLKKCAKLRSLNLQREDVVELKWDLKGTVVSSPLTIILLKVTNRNNLMMTLSAVPSEMKIQNINLLSSALDDTSSVWEINFEIKTLHDLKLVQNYFDKTGLVYDIILEQKMTASDQSLKGQKGQSYF